MTIEEIKKVESYCTEYCVTRREALKYFGFSKAQYYNSRSKLCKKQSVYTVRDEENGTFIPVGLTSSQQETCNYNSSLQISISSKKGINLQISGPINADTLKAIIGASIGGSDV